MGSIQESIQVARYMVAIFSDNYFAKNWPQLELNLILRKEVAAGNRILLPILHNISAESATQHIPVLSDRFAIKSSVGLQKVVYSMMQVILGPSDFPLASSRLANYMREIELKTGRHIQC